MSLRSGAGAESGHVSDVKNPGWPAGPRHATGRIVAALKGLVTLGSDPARFRTKPPACYRASWQLPGRDFHRQATTCLRTRRSTMALPHGVAPRSAGRTKDQGWAAEPLWPLFTACPVTNQRAPGI